MEKFTVSVMRGTSGGAHGVHVAHVGLHEGHRGQLFELQGERLVQVLLGQGLHRPRGHPTLHRCLVLLLLPRLLRLWFR